LEGLDEEEEAALEEEEERDQADIEDMAEYKEAGKEGSKKKRKRVQLGYED